MASLKLLNSVLILIIIINKEWKEKLELFLYVYSFAKVHGSKCGSSY